MYALHPCPYTLGGITVARILSPQNGGMNHGRQAPYATPLRRRSAIRSRRCSRTHQPNKEGVARLMWFRRKTEMDKTKFFTEQADVALRVRAHPRSGVDEATSAEQGHDHDDHELRLRIFRLVRVP